MPKIACSLLYNGYKNQTAQNISEILLLGDISGLYVYAEHTLRTLCPLDIFLIFENMLHVFAHILLILWIIGATIIKMHVYFNIVTI